MKPYYIGAGFFAVGFLILGVLATSFLDGSATAPDKKKPSAAAGASTGKMAPPTNADAAGAVRKRPATGPSASAPAQMQAGSPQGLGGSLGSPYSSGSSGSSGSPGSSGSLDSSGLPGSSLGVGFAAAPGTPIGPGTGLPHVSTAPSAAAPKVPALQPAPIAGRGGAVGTPQ